MSSWRVQSCLIISLSVLHIVWTVPPQQCLVPFNHSDCNLPPRVVYTYYKPGSRCEREVWRGCPTLNKFENEYLCHMNCIFRDSKVKECEIPLNSEVCDLMKLQTVYTHENGRCVRAKWGGCPTYNKFGSKAECVKKCNVGNKEATQESAEDGDVLQDLNTLLTYIINKTEENPTTNATDLETTDEGTNSNSAELAQTANGSNNNNVESDSANNNGPVSDIGATAVPGTNSAELAQTENGSDNNAVAPDSPDNN